ncbi:O-antigen ligase [Rhodoblastus acidophilus]|uniref:O-antigen ligase family protein n=1 Tax=Rhodoblastus acidophilus TaxID=1074 RepID=UPI00222416F4|nr:O-antigen ligase family protein [Rhodoblastus acidophilus]MCW2284306.1 O-antigen ligase [Rhodoblastus acidophilus]MCW2333216.1 O-antigen ligase [Rhodoblastus acidophilus]
MLAATLAGLAWAPFCLGSNRPVAWGVNGILFPSLALAYEVSLLLRGRKHPVSAKRIAVPFGLFLLVVAWIGIQMLALGNSSLSHPIWMMAGDALGVQLNGAISVNPSATALALMRLLTDASLLWLIVQLCRRSERAMLTIEAVMAIVAVYAGYGLLLAAFYGSDIPFFDAPNTGHFVRSTFINRNNFATFAGLGLIACVALMLRLYRHAANDLQGLGSFRVSRLIEATGRLGWVLIGAAFIDLVALLGTVSRGAILSTILGLFALLVLSFARRRRGGAQQIEAILFVAVVLVGGFLAFGDKIVGRISETGLADTSRMAVYAIVVRSLFDAPYLGFGYGTFADVFPMYRDQSISPVGVWDRAHNAYLEVLQGLGLVFGAALILSLAWLAWKCLRGAVNRRRDATAPIVAASAALLVGVHSLVDFSLQIEAVTLTFMALLGAGVAQSESSRHVLSD